MAEIMKHTDVSYQRQYLGKHSFNLLKRAKTLYAQDFCLFVSTIYTNIQTGNYFSNFNLFSHFLFIFLRYTRSLWIPGYFI